MAFTSSSDAWGSCLHPKPTDLKEIFHLKALDNVQERQKHSTKTRCRVGTNRKYPNDHTHLFVQLLSHDSCPASFLSSKPSLLLSYLAKSACCCGLVQRKGKGRGCFALVLRQSSWAKLVFSRLESWQAQQAWQAHGNVLRVE